MYYPNALRWSVDRSTARGKPLPRWVGAIPIRFTQWLLERRHAQVRAELFKARPATLRPNGFRRQAGITTSFLMNRIQQRELSMIRIEPHKQARFWVRATTAAVLVWTVSAVAGELPVLDCVIEPYEVADVSSAAEGVIEMMHVERNDLVTKNQILADLESDVEKASLAFAHLNASLDTDIKLRRVGLEFDQRNHTRIDELYTKKAIPLHHKDEAETDAAKSRWLLMKANRTTNDSPRSNSPAPRP